MNQKTKTSLPKDGLPGLKENFMEDFSAGFVVFLLAMPLSLGIAEASGFPAIMGLVTAILGGVLVSFFAGSRLTIKGPAAGLIVVVAASVQDFGGGVEGWKLALGAMVFSGVLQVLFGLLKLGKLVDIFPISAIHGMLAAIGLIIIIKQLPVLLAVDPNLSEGLSIVDTLRAIPVYLENLDGAGTVIGLVSLGIMFLWPLVRHESFKKIPAPLLVLVVAIPLQTSLDFASAKPDYLLLHVGGFLGNIAIQASFDAWSQHFIFIKYVLMFALVGTLESLLTVKAIDHMDPFRRKSNPDQDLIAVGVGNTIAAFLGGLPMISEVARSSANISSGAKTRWANFFHGLIILVFVLAATSVIEMIPNAALAAMLIAVGYKLAHPQVFRETYKIGMDQFVIFLTTILFTLFTDLLVGIAAGVVMKILIHLWNGVPPQAFFYAPTSISSLENGFLIRVSKAAVFTNFLRLKIQLEALPKGKKIVIDLAQTKLVDHSVMDGLHLFSQDYEENGGSVALIGLERHKPFSQHPLAGRKLH
ncbi:SulP family inorganic anion transporter [Algoriphagus namhaensis]